MAGNTHKSHNLWRCDLCRRLSLPVELIVTIILFLNSWSQIGVAAGCSDALLQYQKGELKNAEVSLLRSLQDKLSSSEMAQCYKLLGLVQYSLGYKVLAQKALIKALRIDPDLSIAKSETLDAEMIPFFEALKRQQKKMAQSAQRPQYLPLNQAPVYQPYPTERPYLEPLPPPIIDEEALAIRARKPRDSSIYWGWDLFFTVLPFGVGQLHQERYLIGGLFLATESFMMFEYVATRSEINNLSQQSKQYISTNCQDFAASSDGERQRQSCISYSDDAQTAINAKSDTAQNYLIGGAFLAAIGAGEAIWHGFISEGSTGPRKKSKDRKPGGFNINFLEAHPDFSTRYQPGRGVYIADGLMLKMRWVID